jgi:hypothetical protein
VQLTDWFVLYEPVAEGMVIYNDTPAQQTVLEGQKVSRSFGFVNVSNKVFSDSLTVRYDLVNNNPASDHSFMKIAPPGPGDTTLFTVPFNTRSKAGMNDVELFVNPWIAPEKSYDNNVVALREHLNVLTDETDPVIEVTFDGRHLTNGDYVSANPNIAIRMWDENPFLHKKDTTGLLVFLAYPCESGDCNFDPVYFTRPDIVWKAATDTSDLYVTFSPRDLAEGEYTLRVEAEDASGNGGDVPYEIAFLVEHDETTRVSPAFPNPFSSETNFEVTITGADEVQCSYKLYITNLNGGIVAESSGGGQSLHVGRNTITWNGTARDGGSLASGMYFYRLVIMGGSGRREYNGKLVMTR